MKTKPQKATWNTEQSSALYHVPEWGDGFFSIDAQGHMVVHPWGTPEIGIDLKNLVDELQERGIPLPILLRFTDILRQRLHALHRSFRNAIDEFGYRASYRGVYPIKVNQQHQVVQTLVEAGRAYDFGLESGSKPELLAILGLLDNPEALVVCNGYKDAEYIELGLLARKLGMNVILVVEKFSELETILQVAERLQVAPSLGIRLRLSTRGAGRWEASGGDRAKFGLGAVETLRALRLLQERGHPEALRLLHFHLGSQVTAIRTLRQALREAARYFVEIKKSAPALHYLDVGGGLAVDYDGSRSQFMTSANYTMQEYANTAVYEVMTICDEAGIEHPVLVSESGRALTAYHSVLVTNVLGVTQTPSRYDLPENFAEAPQQIRDLHEICAAIDASNLQESYHDVLDLRDQLLDMFKLGYVSLEWRGVGESIAWAALHKIWQTAQALPYVPEELERLEKELADIYFCNFSVFQSLPDAWAIDHLFPIMPIHRLDEAPARQAVLADITCDSDGKIDRFVGLPEMRQTLPLHPLRPGEPYLLGFFMVGAYQEILGDLHNLFGDNNAVTLCWDEEAKTYRIEHVEDGDTVTEVLNYVQQNRDELLRRFRRKVEAAVRRKAISIEASRTILEKYRGGFDGYTYSE